MEVFSVRVFLPLFHVRYEDAWGIRLSPRLPPPRTILGALAKGVGVVLGVEGGEVPIGEKRARELLMDAVESCSYGFVRPLSPLVKTSQILRVVPAIEQKRVTSDIFKLKGGGLVNQAAKFHDAFKHDVVVSGEMEFVYALSLEELNDDIAGSFGGVGREEVLSALRMIDRVGSTESLCGVLSVKHVGLKEVGPRATVNTYVPVEDPAKWVEPVHAATRGYLIEPLYPNLRVVGMKRVEDVKSMKINFLLPIYCSEVRRGREVFEPTEVLVDCVNGYSVYSLHGTGDGETRIVLPRGELDGLV
ncbi:MAG: type I-A CRISPR-associated protein Cas5a [Candidatus Jordarchaeales archaeon]|nr:type I-A CRISPR-associated protein Cas5 [Candidatus Jordarchaeia archaeon]